MAFSALEALQAFGLGRQMAEKERQLARREAQEVRQQRARTQAGKQVQAGDLSAAAMTAFEAGDDDLLQNLGRLSTAQRQQAAMEASAGIAAAEALARIPDDAARAAAAAQLAPQLRAAGFSEQELAEATQDLSIPTLQARAAYLRQIATGLGGGRGAQPTTMQRNFDWIEQRFGPQRAEQYITRQTAVTPRPITDPTTGQTYWVYPDTGQQAPPPDTLTDEEIDAMEEGGPEQPAPANFPPGAW